ncbi:D-sedoheptulose 7-phosphate isomerase [Candidatus Woesearchaeota archaeon]|nr:D-sedoheptulose 7-phosphate isomerase [Candidatus Woesearchaeota archaeon]
MEDIIKNHIEGSATIKLRVVETLLYDIEQAAQLCIGTYKNGKKMLIAGNGGSAADAQHVAGELMNYFRFDRQPLPAVSLSTDTSVMTAISNDSHYRNVFSKQLRALGEKGDVFVALSTSGNSENVLEAIAAAKEKGITVIGFTGETGGEMADKCDHIIKIPSCDVAKIQESHMCILHVICELIEQAMFPREAIEATHAREQREQQRMKDGKSPRSV